MKTINLPTINAGGGVDTSDAPLASGEHFMINAYHSSCEKLLHRDLDAGEVSCDTNLAIPTFPNFKKLELSDQPSIESYTHRYQPYSDFNPTNLWAWDTNCERKISELNGNLVVLFTDYKTCEPFLSFLGTNKPEDTAQQLLHFAKTSGISPALRFLTEESIQYLRTCNLKVEEDRDHFDYIFSTSELADLRGTKFKAKRQSAHRFLREYPNASFEIRELSDTAIQEQVVSVLRRWENKKNLDGKECYLEQEEIALNRLLKTAHAHKLILSCVFLSDVMLGFSVDGILPRRFAVSHFLKADNSFKGVYEFLNQKTSQYLLSNDVVLWNWEQDVGVENLRSAKMSYRPVHFLKTYKVSFDSQEIEQVI